MQHLNSLLKDNVVQVLSKSKKKKWKQQIELRPPKQSSALTIHPGSESSLTLPLSVSWRTVSLTVYQLWKVSDAPSSVLTGVYEHHRRDRLWRVWTGPSDKESTMSRNLLESPLLNFNGWRMAARYFTAPALSVRELSFICRAAR